MEPFLALITPLTGGNQPPGQPAHPIAPGGQPPYPDQGLPPFPSHPIAPGGGGQQPPGIWGPTDPRPTHPIAPGGAPPYPDQGLPPYPSHPIAPGGQPPYPDQGLPPFPAHPIAPGGDPASGGPIIVPPGQPAPESLTVFIKPDQGGQWSSVKYVPSSEPKPGEQPTPPAPATT